MAPLRVRPLITRTAGLDFGAEVRPQSLPLPPDELAAVAAALEAHGVVVLRLPTPLSDEEHVAFGEGLAATLGSRLESDADGPIPLFLTVANTRWCTITAAYCTAGGRLRRRTPPRVGCSV